MANPSIPRGRGGSLSERPSPPTIFTHPRFDPAPRHRATGPCAPSEHVSPYAYTMLPLHELRRIAVEAECDPRTVARVLRGEPVRYLPHQRILKALRSLGHAEEPGDQTPGAHTRERGSEDAGVQSPRQASQGDKSGQ